MRPPAAAPVAWAGQGCTASWPALPGATEPPASWSALATITAPVSLPRAPAIVTLASTARPASTPVPLVSTGLAARGRASVSMEPLATRSAASVSALLASMASSARGGVSQAHSERAAASGVTARVVHPVTLSLATAFAPQGAWGPPVTLTAEWAFSGPAVPCPVPVGVGPTATLSVGSASAWMATQGPRASKVGPPSSPRSHPQPWAQRPHTQPLTDQHPGYAAGQSGTSSEAAPAGAHPLSAAKGTRALVTTKERCPWARTLAQPLPPRAVDSCTASRSARIVWPRGGRPHWAQLHGAQTSGWLGSYSHTGRLC